MLLALNLVLPVYANSYATTEEKSAVLNLAGKERMLTQKISKDILHIRSEIDDLKKNIDEFDQILNGLLKGDPEHKLIKTADPAILKQLNKVSELWQPFRENVEAVLAGDISSERVDKITQQNMPLMENMNSVVDMYEKAFFDSLEPGMATTLNLAGKQRMLSQKMAKEAQLVLRNVNPEENRANLKESMSLFDKTMKGLLEGDSELGLPGTQEDTPIYKQLMADDKIWHAYKPILEKIVSNNKYTDEQREASIAEARRVNLILLMNLHRTVNMYEQAAGLRSSSLRPWQSKQ
jgi:hypothetical protein